jgi:aerotaxis receptor
MRINQPITDREFDFPPGVTLMSTTDTQSHITYANAAFVAVSGYEREELTQQPHNLVRHPDMPVEAFADMWRTLKGGESWTALVKNRRKNGDHYWVRANAAPMQRGGRLVGYMSVRTPPSREEIAGAQELYRKFREGRAKGLAFHKGLVVRKGLLSFISVMQWLPARWRLRGALTAIVATLAGTALVPGLAPAAVVGVTTFVALLACLWLETRSHPPLAAAAAPGAERGCRQP